MKERKKLSLSSSSAATIAGNDDLLTEILVLLPVKSLVRFKSVSTHWKVLISHDSFKRLHLLNCTRRRPESQQSFILGVRGRSQFFICRPTLKKLIRFPVSLTHPPSDHVKILQSCNGLLLLKTKPYGGGHTIYWIFNPVTKDRKYIYGMVGSQQGDPLPLALCLLFDPSKSPYYRIVGFWGKISDRIKRCSVFDSATDEWTDCESLRARGNIFDGVSCNGRAYFVRTTNLSFYYSEEGKMFTIHSPPKRSCNRYIMESNGHLYCIYLSFKENKPFFDIFEMIDYQWLACEKRAGMYALDDTARVKDTTRVELLGMIRTERIEDSTFLVHVPGRIMIYRFDKVCEVLVNYRSDYFYEDDILLFEFKDAHPFTASFASV